MKLFNLFAKSAKNEPARGAEKTLSLEERGVYSGMRVEVMDMENQLLFIAKLMGLHENSAELHQYSETEISSYEEEMKIRIRGYNDSDKKVIYLEGILMPGTDSIRMVQELVFIKSGNDRAFFRLNIDIDGSMTMAGKVGAVEEPCKLLNISVGGACVRTKMQCNVGDRFLLQVKLHPERDVSLIFSEVCRIIEKEDTEFEYGCRFIELNEADQKHIIQAIFERQRKKNYGSV